MYDREELERAVIEIARRLHLETKEPPALLSVEEAGRLLALGRTKTYMMVANGEMPGVLRLGHSVRISRKALLDWIDQQTMLR